MIFIGLSLISISLLAILAFCQDILQKNNEDKAKVSVYDDTCKNIEYVGFIAAFMRIELVI